MPFNGSREKFIVDSGIETDSAVSQESVFSSPTSEISEVRMAAALTW